MTEGDANSSKVIVLLQPVANAPILKRKKFVVDPSRDIAWFTTTIRKMLQLAPDESLFFYISQTFAPSPDHTFEMSHMIQIDHDEEDRESSEYEEIDEDQDGDFAENSEMPLADYLNVGELPENYQFENIVVEEEILDTQLPSTSMNESSDVIYHSIVEGPACIVCGRGESEKIRLFRWPKNQRIRTNWIHFFRLRPEILQTGDECFICSFHFAADTFIMVSGKIYWKATPMPKYRARRPCNTEPFPWEQSAKDKPIAEKAQSEQPQYKIRYRMSYNKYKSRSSHPVAVLSPVNEPHLFYEFHYNRTSTNNTKFYSCLNCRRAKAKSGIRDVIRTIHLDNCRLLSQHDPFLGHHFACRPHNVYDDSSSWRSISDRPNDQRFVDDVVYVDEHGNPIQWENCERISSTMEFEPAEDPHEVFALDEHILEMDADSKYYSHQPEVKQKGDRIKKLKCHLCFRRSFNSTKEFADHLQFHVMNETNCKKCQSRISCDDPPLLTRRQLCKTCWKHR
ncbi:unnamed protein product [Caenorhabditis bovis]|uniref:THAP-type domain-containing protein n=1 Tax=Caenorhabditis bovis TaxID=2654633 RepID=A0A8S1ECN7_9PELO|nr:unnamed protein product [Caenorhabditis bovis]